MLFVPESDDLVLTLADIFGINPFAAEPGVDAFVQIGIDAYSNFYGTIFFTDWLIMGTVG